MLLCTRRSWLSLVAASFTNSYHPISDGNPQRVPSGPGSFYPECNPAGRHGLVAQHLMYENLDWVHFIHFWSVIPNARIVSRSS